MKLSDRTSIRAVSILVAVACGAALIYIAPTHAGCCGRVWHDITHPSATRATKAVKKGISDVGKAGKASAKFFDQQRRLPFETAEGALHQANIGKSLEYLATNPLRQSNKNAQQALKSSPLQPPIPVRCRGAEGFRILKSSAILRGCAGCQCFGVHWPQSTAGFRG
jgi:hypothetical protein